MPSNGDKATLQHHADRKRAMIPLPSNYLPLFTETRRNKDIIWKRRGSRRRRESTRHTRGFQQDPIFCLECKSGKTIEYVLSLHE
jgi:hypothetical protein